MDKDLFQASLNDEAEEGLQSYNISKLFYVAFFGGIIPTLALSTKNAKSLRLDRVFINLMIVLGIGVIIIKAVVVGIYAAGAITINSSIIRNIFRGAALVYYLMYYMKMKPHFYQFVITGGEYKPLLKDALIWIAIGIVVEMAINTLAVLVGRGL